MRLKKWVSHVFLILGLGFAWCFPAFAAELDGFVGSEKCAGCHKPVYDSWKQTLHSRIILSKEEGLLKAAGESWEKDSKGNAGPVKGNGDGKDYKMDDVVMVNGTKWKQRYLVLNPETGHHQFLDKQWNSVHKQWEPYGNKSDWETKCATCHTTGYSVLSYSPENPVTQKITYSEPNVACEACHGPGAEHIETAGKVKPFNPAKASVEEASLVCGYCHVRKENEMYKTSQGEKREEQPHPVLGQTYKAGMDDWRTWAPEKMVIPGIEGQPLSKEYEGGLKDAFYLDDKAKEWESYDARKHHQQWQEFIQSEHYQQNIMSCSGCHTPHATSKKAYTMPSQQTCTSCHGDKVNMQTIMPGLGVTAKDLGMRAHTFNPKQDRTSLPTADGAQIEYYYPRKP